MLDSTTLHSGLKPYYWIYASIDEIEIKTPKHIGRQHKTVSNFLETDDFFEPTRDNFWGHKNIIPQQDRKILIWEQAHPMPFGCPRNPKNPHRVDQPIKDVSQLLKVTSDFFRSQDSLQWRGKGLDVNVKSTSADLCLKFNEKAQENIADFTQNLIFNARSRNLHFSNYHGAQQPLSIRLAKRPFPNDQRKMAKNSAQHIADRFDKFATKPQHIKNLIVGVGLYDISGNRVDSHTMAVIKPNGCIQKQHRSLTNRVMALA